MGSRTDQRLAELGAAYVAAAAPDHRDLIAGIFKRLPAQLDAPREANPFGPHTDAHRLLEGSATIYGRWCTNCHDWVEPSDTAPKCSCGHVDDEHAENGTCEVDGCLCAGWEEADD